MYEKCLTSSVFSDKQIKTRYNFLLTQLGNTFINICCCSEFLEGLRAHGARLLPTTSPHFCILSLRFTKCSPAASHYFLLLRIVTLSIMLFLFYYLLCALGTFHFNQDTGSTAKWQRMICKEISIGSLLRQVFRGWLGNRRGKPLGRGGISRS